MTLARIEPFIVGALVAAVGAWIAVVLYFMEKYALATVTSAITIAALLALKFVLL